MNLTIRQKEILDYLKAYLDKFGVAPTVTEIKEHFNLRSVATVHKHLQALENRSCIRRAKHQARAIEIVRNVMSVGVEIPMQGLIAAGRPVETFENPDILTIPEDMVGRTETYALQVEGDSMITDGIHPGDYIVVESRNDAKAGDIVVALVNNSEATVKRFYKEGSMIRLQPSNPVMEPMFFPLSHVQVQGVVIGLIRKYRR